MNKIAVELINKNRTKGRKNDNKEVNTSSLVIVELNLKSKTKQKHLLIISF